MIYNCSQAPEERVLYVSLFFLPLPTIQRVHKLQHDSLCVNSCKHSCSIAVGTCLLRLPEHFTRQSLSRGGCKEGEGYKVTRLQDLQSHSVKTPDCWAEMMGKVLERKV